MKQQNNINIPYVISARILEKVRGKLENKTCFDCPEKNPQWASLQFGVLLCQNCAGNHRGLGVDTSFIRSTLMDGWKVSQLRRMFAGGNDNANQYFAKYGMNHTNNLISKYCSKSATLYKSVIDEKVKEYEFDNDVNEQIIKYIKTSHISTDIHISQDKTSSNTVISYPNTHKVKTHKTNTHKINIPFLNDSDFDGFDIDNLEIKEEPKQDNNEYSDSDSDSDFDFDKFEVDVQNNKMQGVKVIIKEEQKEMELKQKENELKVEKKCEKYDKWEKYKNVNNKYSFIKIEQEIENKKINDVKFTSLYDIANQIKKAENEKNWINEIIYNRINANVSK